MNKAELIKALRNATQAGMADCIKALDECNNDLEEAQKWLREKGIAKANKKASAVAYEGIVKVGVKDSRALIMEVNSQTDFTAKNEQFLKLVYDIYNDIFKNVDGSKEIDANSYIFNGKPLKDAGIELTAITGEKIAFRRGFIYEANLSSTIGAYTHSNNKIASLVIFNGNIKADIAQDVAMHVAALAPKYLNESCVDKTWLDSEKEILRNQFYEELNAINDEKAKSEKEKRAEIIVEGKVKKLIKEICLVNQPFVKDNSKTIAQYVKENGGEIIMMMRYELGEGFERKESNFAEEVASQMSK